MAAVAGSKGRIHPTDETFARLSFQASLAGRLLAEEIAVSDVVSSLLDQSRLREVGLDTNMICNLSCKYCYLDDRPESKGHISPATWVSFLGPLIASGCKLVAFIGKEPLGDTIALDAIAGLNSLPERKLFRIGMVTNGTLIDRRVDRLAQSRLDYLDVSLDAFGSANDDLRGSGVFERVSKNLELIIASKPSHDFSVTSVLHKRSAMRYVEFVKYLFSLGINTVFGSPILKFTEKDAVSGISLVVDDVLSLLEVVAAYLGGLGQIACADRQIIIDLPYKYSWALLRSGNVIWRDIKQDRYEAHYWQPDSRVPLYVKFNFFPMSYWRAIRITHDGRVLENMDLAAHRLYREESRLVSDAEGRWYHGKKSPYHWEFLTEFIRQHAAVTSRSQGVYDREVGDQYRHMVAMASAA